MTKQEYLRLSSIYDFQRRQPRANANCIGKRHAKGSGKAVGQVLKSSRVKPQVGLERVFIKRK